MLACPAIAIAQQERPILYEYNPPMTTYEVYEEHGQQGREMYQNNSHFYNKDNVLQNRTPVGNGFYHRPGYSNPINREMHEGPGAPSTIIYNGYIPVRQVGGTRPERGKR